MKTLNAFLPINSHLVSGGRMLFLKDDLTNLVHDLSESTYSFAFVVGTFNSSFEIVNQEL